VISGSLRPANFHEGKSYTRMDAVGLTSLRHSRGKERGRDGHAGRGGFPHQIDLGGGQAVGLIDEVAELPLQVQSFGGDGAGGLDGTGVFGAQSLDPGGG